MCIQMPMSMSCLSLSYWPSVQNAPEPDLALLACSDMLHHLPCLVHARCSNGDCQGCHTMVCAQVAEVLQLCSMPGASTELAAACLQRCAHAPDWPAAEIAGVPAGVSLSSTPHEAPLACSACLLLLGCWADDPLKLANVLLALI